MTGWRDPGDNHAQRGMLHSTAPWNYLIGGRGVGKTAVLVMRCMIFSIAFPGLQGMITEQTNKDIGDTLIPCFRAMVPKHLYKWRKEDGGWNVLWANGSITMFRTRQAKNAMADPPFHGPTIGWLGVDELSLDKRTDVLTVAGMMVRQDVPLLMVDITCTPRRNWLYGHMLSKGIANPGQQVQHSPDGQSVAFYGQTKDNLFNKDLHGRMIGNVSEREARQYLYGEWVEEEGRIWTGFSEEQFPNGNIIDYTFNKNAPYALTVDHGGRDGYWGIIQPVTGHGGGFNDPVWVLCAEWTPDEEAYKTLPQIKEKYGKPTWIYSGHDHRSPGNDGRTAEHLFVAHGWGHVQPVSGELIGKTDQAYAMAQALCNTAGERRLLISSTIEQVGPGPTRGARDMLLNDTYADPGKKPFRKEKDKGIYHEDSRDALKYFCVSRWPPIWSEHTKWAA